jgi:ABC-type dipeptide/oligopeptide/nickel transport system permease component
VVPCVLTYVAMRLGHALAVLLCVVFVVSVLVKLIPGDPVDIMSAGNPGITPAQKQELREQLGLTRPLFDQFVSYVGGALHGDLGQSIRFRTSALRIVLERLPATCELTLVAMVIAVALAVPLGVVTALHQGGVVDYAGSIFSILGVSIPSFLLGILMVLFVSVDLGLLPAAGRGQPLAVAIVQAIATCSPAIFWKSFRYLILPALALATSVIAWNARLTRSAMLEALRQDYVRFATAKGLPRPVVILRHALRNAVVPTLTIVGLQVGYLLSGSFVIENVFAWPGVGRLAVQAVLWRDYPVIQAVVLVTAILFLAINLLLDLLYRLVDPRIRYGRG